MDKTSPTRRDILSLLGVGLTAGLAGCNSLTDTESSPDSSEQNGNSTNGNPDISVSISTESEPSQLPSIWNDHSIEDYQAEFTVETGGSPAQATVSNGKVEINQDSEQWNEDSVTVQPGQMQSGEQGFTATAQKNNSTAEDTIQASKPTPGNYKIDVIPERNEELRSTIENNSDEENYIETAAHFLVKEVHDRDDLMAPVVRPKSDVTPADDEQEDQERPGEFSDEEIRRTTRLAHEHTFGAFESDRAENASYDDSQFFELQTFLGMTGCGTAQGAARFQYREQGETPHGDTHLRTVKQFSPQELVEGVDQAVSQITSTITSEAAFRRPVTVAIDITTVPYYGDVEGMEMVSGVEAEDERAFKFATLSVVGYNVPLILAVEPVRESSPWDENPSNEMHHIVRRLVRRASQHVPIETVLCDREFDSKDVFQTLSNLDVNYLIPTRRGPTEEEILEKMTARGEDVAVERARIEVESGSHGCRFLYVPSSSGEGTAVFVTNVDVGPDAAVSFCRRYSRRWQIEARTV